MATINYKLAKKIDKDSKKSMILVRVCVSRVFRVEGKTTLYVKPKDWDKKNGCVRKISRIENRDRQVELQELTSTLNRLSEHISTQIINTKELGKITEQKDKKEWLDYVIKLFFDPSVVLQKEKNLSFKTFAKTYVKIRSKEENWKPAIKKTNQKHKWEDPRYDKLCAVQTWINKMNPKLMMDDITANTLDDYQQFLINNGFKNNTIDNHISYFKQILKWADVHGYLKHGKEVIDHKTPVLKKAKPKAVNFLKWDEFLKLYEYKFSEDESHLELTRDRFCFCCATSLRYSDLEILRVADFDDMNNPTQFSFVSKKTEDSLTIPLNEYSRSLFFKYRDIDTEGGLLFPKKSNQKMNENLKVIAKKLGFTREITKMQYSGVDRLDQTQRLCDVIGTHSARRTFVVHALEKGWSPQMVMSYTGHEDYGTMKPYIAITDENRKKMMINF